MGRDRAVLAAFLGTALLAGGNSVAIRFSNRELDPLWGATLRFAFASAVLVCISAAMRLALPRRRAFAGTVLWGLLQFAGGFGLYHYALVRLHAGLGQTLLALVPLATLLLAVVQREERLRTAAIVGTFLGLIGIGVISRDALSESVQILSLLAVLGSVLCFGQATVLLRRVPRVHPVVMNALGMVISAVILLLASVVSGETLDVPELGNTWAALAYVSVVGSVVVFVLYVFVNQRWSASRTSYVMILIPFVTIVLSAWLDAERIDASLLVGGVLVIAGVYVGALRGADVDAAPTLGR